MITVIFIFVFQAEDGIRDLVRSRGLGDVYKRQPSTRVYRDNGKTPRRLTPVSRENRLVETYCPYSFCLLYTSDAADERSSVDLGGRRIIKKKNTNRT